MKIKDSKSIAEKTQDHMDITNQLKNIFIIIYNPVKESHPYQEHL